MNVIARVLNTIFVLVLAVPAFAQQDVRLTALNAREGKPALYELSLTLTDSLQPDASLELVIPQQLDFSRVKVVGSPSIPGGFKHEKKDSVLVLRRTGLGPVIPAGKKVKIIFGPVATPKQFNQNPVVRIRIVQAGRKSPVTSAAIIFQKDERVF